jgi:hypothetical protein
VRQAGSATGLKGEAMKIRIAFNGETMTATLEDNSSARDFASMLPLDLTIDSYADNEKISYLPRKLTEEGSGPAGQASRRPGCHLLGRKKSLLSGLRAR